MVAGAAVGVAGGSGHDQRQVTATLMGAVGYWQIGHTAARQLSGHGPGVVKSAEVGIVSDQGRCFRGRGRDKQHGQGSWWGGVDGCGWRHAATAVDGMTGLAKGVDRQR